LRVDGGDETKLKVPDALRRMWFEEVADEIMSEYRPGVCNIGSAEIARRMRAGWIGVGATAIVSLVLVLFHVPTVWRLSLFVPAFFAATGLLQASCTSVQHLA
jgi:hypothetical protein